MATQWLATPEILGAEENALDSPSHVAVHSSGNVYIADTFGSRILRLDAREQTLSSVAGTGVVGNSGDGGLATNALLRRPRGIALDGLGNLFIVDQRDYRVRRVDGQSGLIETVAGSGVEGFSGDGGPATSAQLDQLDAIAVDGLGTLYLSTQGRIRQVDARSGVITTRVGRGNEAFSGDGALAIDAEIERTRALHVDGDQNIYMATGNRVRRVDGQSGVIETVAGTGSFGHAGDGGPALLAALEEARGFSIDADGNFYIATSRHVRRVDHETALITTVAGSNAYGFGGDGEPAVTSTLNLAGGLAINAGGDLFLADTRNHRVRRIDKQSSSMTTAAGNGSSGVSGDGGFATAAALSLSMGVALDGQGNVLVADSGTHRIRLIDRQSGVVSTLVGEGSAGFSGDGGQARSARLSNPADVASDGQGTLFIAEASNNRIRRVDGQSGVITTVAGSGRSAFSGDGDLAIEAEIHGPRGVAVDSQGHVFIADSFNHRVRRVDGQSGIITTVAGDGVQGFAGDEGLALNARLDFPYGLAVDGQGGLFIADSGNKRIRYVDALTGVITTVAGNDAGAGTGDGRPATLTALGTTRDLSVDGQGNLYIAEGHRVRYVDAQTGVISTLAGTGLQGPDGDGGLAIDA